LLAKLLRGSHLARRSRGPGRKSSSLGRQSVGKPKWHFSLGTELSLKHCRENLADLTWISFYCKDRIGYLLTRPVGRPPANSVRFQLHALAYNPGNFLRTLATPEPIKDWSLTSLKDKLIKIGAKVVSYGRYVIFQMAEVAIAWMFQEIDLSRNCGCCRRRHRQRRPIFMHQRQPTGGVRPNATQNGQTDPRTPCRSLLCRKSPLYSGRDF